MFFVKIVKNSMFLGLPPVYKWGSEAMKQRVVPPVLKGEKVICLCVTEPTAGSDAASIKAEGRVFKDDDGEIKVKLNFAKRYITLAPIADLFSLFARTDGERGGKGVTAFLIERGTEGLLTSGSTPVLQWLESPIILTVSVQSLWRTRSIAR